MPPAKPLSQLLANACRCAQAWKHEAGDFTPWLAEAAEPRRARPIALGLRLIRTTSRQIHTSFASGRTVPH
jgi:hypothetical protein